MPGHTRASCTPPTESAACRSGSAALPRYLTPAGSVSSSSSKAVSFSDSVSSVSGQPSRGRTHATPAPSFHSIASDYPPTYRSGAPSDRSDVLSHVSSPPSYHSHDNHSTHSVRSAHSGSHASHRSSPIVTSAYAGEVAINPALAGAAPFSLLMPPDRRFSPYHEPAFHPSVDQVRVYLPLVTGLSVKVDVVNPRQTSPTGLCVGDVLNALVSALQDSADHMLVQLPPDVQAATRQSLRHRVGLRIIDLLSNGCVFTKLSPHPQRPGAFIMETRAA
ncbi:hypothetical protein HDZ31DRAFT_84527 [Schizophyllum fasciatum]